MTGSESAIVPACGKRQACRVEPPQPILLQAANFAGNVIIPINDETLRHRGWRELYHGYTDHKTVDNALSTSGGRSNVAKTM